MNKKGTNKKIRNHMRRLGQRVPSEWYLHASKQIIDERPDTMHTTRDIVDLLTASRTDQGDQNKVFASVRSALYDLAADDEIAFVSKTFHVWEIGDQLKNTRCVFYGKSNPYRAPILDDWLCDDEGQEGGAIARIDAEIDKRREEIDALISSKCEILRSLFETHKEAFLKLAKEQK